MTFRKFNKFTKNKGFEFNRRNNTKKGIIRDSSKVVSKGSINNNQRIPSSRIINRLRLSELSCAFINPKLINASTIIIKFFFILSFY